MATANYVLLQRIELNASASSVTFSNIPQSGYTDLKIVMSARGTRAANQDDFVVAFNGSSSGFSYRQLYGGAGSGSIVTGSSSGSTGFSGIVPAANNTASTFSSQEFYIPNYTSNTNKSFSIDSVSENNATTNWQLDLIAQLWSNTAAITSITFTPNNGSWAANSTFSLYGLAALGTTPVIAPKASGGNITTDGTYWYHTFLSSGTFTPQTALSCDILQIAGGGGGGNNYGGGGGAGGITYATGSSLTTSNYAVTVGAGGAGGAANSSGTSGTNSILNSITALGGGGGAGGSGSTGGTVAGTSGGSGGGGQGNDNGAGGASGSATQGSGTGYTGYGNAGGSGYGASGGAAGGGGGSGAAGANGTAGVGGAGGAGKNTWSSWASATSTGVSGYYAGGGGANANGTNASGGSGGGGNAGNPATAGTTNTGSGGGGSGTTAGAGGSGIVIVRYTVA